MITSTANAQVKNVITLLKKSGERKKRGLFVIEGIRMFSELPKDRIEKGVTLETNPELNPDNASTTEERFNIEVKKAVFQYIEAESGLTTDQIIILISFETVDTLMTICRNLL